MNKAICDHASGGCDYPAGECSGACMAKQSAKDTLDVLYAARAQIEEDRQGLIAGHQNFVSGRVEDTLGRSALARYNRVLRKIDRAIKATGGVL
ncbi:hypothetical protein [Cupriavidus sp. RAF12]|uniref:hypothetical protein n=1 Tax=Cupriavidus sp. RAF12 TaxID=3233050 RepID=UPI003F936741